MSLVPLIPKLVAHRGYRKNFPENTIAAMHGAAAVGARYVECDVQLTRDLEPVLFHDTSMQRMCAQTGTIFDYRWKQVKTLSAGEQGRLGTGFLDEPIAHLSDFVEFLQANPKIRAFVEMKEESIEAWGLDAVFKRVLEVLEPVQSKVDMISFSYDWCDRVRRGSEYPVGYIANDWEEASQKRVKDLGAEFFCVDWKKLPENGRLKGPAAALFAWEIADAKLAKTLHARGLDFVETFEIGEMLEAIKAR